MKLESNPRIYVEITRRLSRAYIRWKISKRMVVLDVQWALEMVSLIDITNNWLFTYFGDLKEPFQ